MTMRITAASVLMATLITGLVQAGRAQAIGGSGSSFCYWIAKGYRQNTNVKVPMRCVDNHNFQGLLPAGYVPYDAPPGYFYWPCCDPPPDTPPPRPPGNEPRPPHDQAPDAPEPPAP
jgi:hypothetical protein